MKTPTIINHLGIPVHVGKNRIIKTSPKIAGPLDTPVTASIHFMRITAEPIWFQLSIISYNVSMIDVTLHLKISARTFVKTRSKSAKLLRTAETDLVR